MTLQDSYVGPSGYPRPPGMTYREAKRVRGQLARAEVKFRRQAIWDALNGGRLITAEEIGLLAGASKRAVWREVERLRALGWIIRGESGVGYSGRVTRDLDV
jgi:biotin operon repressor